jgi:hypothetical protein
LDGPTCHTQMGDPPGNGYGVLKNVPTPASPDG